jgi:hypothetical protein
VTYRDEALAQPPSGAPALVRDGTTPPNQFLVLSTASLHGAALRSAAAVSACRLSRTGCDDDAAAETAETVGRSSRGTFVSLVRQTRLYTATASPARALHAVAAHDPISARAVAFSCPI